MLAVGVRREEADGSARGSPSFVSTRARDRGIGEGTRSPFVTGQKTTSQDSEKTPRRDTGRVGG